MQTIFANVINLKLAATELVLEFGSFFPDKVGVGPPSDYKPDVRVVMNIAALDTLLRGLSQAAAAQRQQQPPQTDPRKVVGFTPPGGG
jgi:hypothetical protein